MKNKFIQKFLEMPSEERRHLRLNSVRPNRKKSLRSKIKWDKDMLIKWVRDYGIKNIEQLKINRKRLEVARKPFGPSFKVFRKFFGKWSALLEEAWGIKPHKREMEVTEEYLMNIVMAFGFDSKRQYLAAHKINPDMVPDIHYVNMKFGGWGNLKHAARMSDGNEMIKDYIKMRVVKGGWPTLAECAAVKIDLSPFILIHGSKEAFDKFLQESERSYAYGV